MFTPESASHLNLSRPMTKSTKWSVRPAKTQINLSIRPVWSESSLSAWRSTGFLVHTERIAKTLIRLDGYPGWSESLLGAHIILLVLSWGSSFIYFNFSLLLYQTFDYDKVQWFLCITQFATPISMFIVAGWKLYYWLCRLRWVIFSKRFNFTQEILDILPAELEFSK